jgi:glutathione S-transferase
MSKYSQRNKKLPREPLLTFQESSQDCTGVFGYVMVGVDTSLPQGPTGAAATLAAKHSDFHPLKLYGGWFCPFVQRVWIVLEEKDIKYEYVELNPYKKEPEFLQLNPRGLVPTLVVPTYNLDMDVKSIYDSLIICEYLEEAYPEPTGYKPRLLPADPYERARCRIWIDHINSKIVPGFYKFLQHTPEKDFTLDEAREDFHRHILTFTREMQPSGPWFLGSEFSMVDICLAPWAKRLWLLDYYKPGGLAMPGEGKGGEDEALWARWRQWFHIILQRKSVNDTWSDNDRYIIAYKRYAEDTTNSLVAQATRLGERLP